jgi:DegV family protein with EDD domain
MSRFIVTDSTATLPNYVIQREQIRVLGMQITIDQMSFTEQIEVSTGAILAALRNNREVTTSQPSIGAIRSVYEECIESGASEILSLHLSSELSGTYATCLNVARDFQIPIHVVDSRSIGLGLGFAVMSATHAAQDLVTLGQQVQQQASKSKVWLFVETLDYLRRGGRLGAAESFVGSALQIKPILHIDNGRLVPFEKVRTTSRAIARLVELAIQAAAEFEAPVSVGVQHAGNRTKAQELAEQIGKKLPGTQVMISELGAVLSAHVGPGALGVVVAPHFNS